MSNPQLFTLLGLLLLLLLVFSRLILRGIGQNRGKSENRRGEPEKNLSTGKDQGDTRDNEQEEDETHSPNFEEEVHKEPTMTLLKSKSKLYHYAAHVTKVYDGDTITVDIDLGLGLWRHDQTIRLWKIDTPELRGPEREDGLRVRDFVRGLILDRDILLRTILDKRGQDRTGKFGRLLGEVLVEDDTQELINVNDLLLEQKMALPMGEDGSRPPVETPASVDTPVPAAVPVEGEPMPTTENANCVECRYCGEARDILFDVTSNVKIVEICPNCLDKRYQI